MSLLEGLYNSLLDSMVPSLYTKFPRGVVLVLDLEI